jgi:hypothetical protein
MPNKNFYTNTKLNAKPFWKIIDSKGNDNFKKKSIAKKSRKKSKNNSESKPSKGPNGKSSNAKLENIKST